MAESGVNLVNVVMIEKMLIMMLIIRVAVIMKLYGEGIENDFAGRKFTNQMVQFGQSTSNITAISMASSALLYSSEEMCGGWASGVGFRDPGIGHRAMMKATQGSKDLCYRYGSDGCYHSKMSEVVIRQLQTMVGAKSDAYQ